MLATSLAFEAFGANLFDQQRGDALLNVFCDVGSTSQLMTRLHLLEEMPLMEKWVSDPTYSDVRYASVSAKIEAYKKVFELKRLDAEMIDGAGLFDRITRAFATANEYERLATNFLLSNPTCYDGVALFSASHPRGPGGATQSNTSATALDAAQHQAVMIAGASLRQRNGEPFGVQYDTLMVGPALAPLARQITGSDVGRVVGISATGAESGTRVAAATIRNVAGLTIYDGGEMRVVVNPRFVGSHANKYLYLDTTKPGCSPVALRVYGERSYALTATDSPERAKRDVYQWGVESDLALIPGAGGRKRLSTRATGT
jgi:hypothetical protein